MHFWQMESRVASYKNFSETDNIVMYCAVVEKQLLSWAEEEGDRKRTKKQLEHKEELTKPYTIQGSTLVRIYMQSLLVQPYL